MARASTVSATYGEVGLQTFVQMTTQETSGTSLQEGIRWSRVTRVITTVAQVTRVRGFIANQRPQTIARCEDSGASRNSKGLLQLCSLLGLLMFAIPVPMIIIGSLFFRECPAQVLIPPYLIVSGSFTLMLLIQCSCPESSNACYKCFSVINTIGFMASHISGAIWVFLLKDADTKDHLSPRYCNQIVYTSAQCFAGTGVSIIALAIIYICFIEPCRR
ncbi:uncharacterized protein LOC135394774 isoform X1 [Ornithodoros turicata]|uniref:uncharacterized protein LOC135394774 isoform X1 n=1 Tax=Ornithodoros turicata TaxID=34597 RepID=UPI003138A531